jgi:hypothetical protein
MTSPILTGSKFNRLTFISKQPTNRNNHAIGIFKCDCGNTCELRLTRVVNGVTKSCGCLKKESAKTMGKSNITHGMKKTSEYRIWAGIKSRCYNPKTSQYKNYGAIGRVMSEEWKNSFVAFLRDMGKRPSNKHSVERIDNSKGYSKENCRWATSKEQTRNTNYNVNLEYNGKTKTIVDWSIDLKINQSTIRERLKSGKSIEYSLTHPIKKHSKKS